jgi:hypothetical protein
MDVEQLSALCGVLVVLLGVSEALPLTRKVKANSWGQLVIAVLKAVAAEGKKSRR